MTIVEIGDERAVVDLSAAELMIINNALHAVCNLGVIPEGDFHSLIGAWPEESRQLLEEVGRAFDIVRERRS